jgi:hypothetical protein
MAMRGLPAPGIRHRRHRSAQDHDPSKPLVLGCLPDQHRNSGHLGLQLQRQLGLNRYETAWMLLHVCGMATPSPRSTSFVCRPQRSNRCSWMYAKQLHCNSMSS